MITTQITSLSIILVLQGSLAQEQARPRGIFIQVQSTSGPSILRNLEGWLQNICDRNAHLHPDNTMVDLVLQKVASQNGDGSIQMRFDVLDKVLPFVRSSCFRNVFVGTVQLQYKGPGSEYKEAMLDPEWRRLNLEQSSEVARQFKQRYPNQVFHWYLNYEANLNYLEDPAVKDGYKSFFKDLIRELTIINSRVAAVMWSPTFWDKWDAVDDVTKGRIRTNLQDLFVSLANTSAPGITWMNLQDSVGKRCLGVTPEDAVGWYNFMKSLYPFRSMQLNVEQFTSSSVDCGYIRESDAAEQIQTEAYYASNGVRMGAAFEIRYWRERYGWG